MPELARPLTVTQISKAKGRKTPYRLADGNGLYLEVRPSGRKSWLIRCRLPNGKQSPAIVIGHFPEDIPQTGLSLADARAKAITLIRAAERGEVVKGVNAAKRERRSAHAFEITAAARQAAEAERFSFRTVATRWLSEKRPTWQSETYRKARLIVETYLIPKLGDMDNSPEAGELELRLVKYEKALGKLKVGYEEEQKHSTNLPPFAELIKE